MLISRALHAAPTLPPLGLGRVAIRWFYQNGKFLHDCGEEVRPDCHGDAKAAGAEPAGPSPSLSTEFPGKTRIDILMEDDALILPL